MGRRCIRDACFVSSRDIILHFRRKSKYSTLVITHKSVKTLSSQMKMLPKGDHSVK